MTAPAPRRAAVLLVWLVAMALGAWLIARAQFSADLSAFLPASPAASERVLVEQLQSGAAARLFMLGIEGGDASARADASRGLAAALRTDARFEQVQNGERVGWDAAGKLIFDHRYQLSPAVTPERTTAAGLRDAIDETLAMLGTPSGAIVQPLLDRDPTGETARIAEALLPAQAPRIEQGVWVSRAAPRAVLLASTHAAGSDLDAQAAALAEMQRAFEPYAARGLTLAVSGAPAFAVASRDRIEHAATRLAVLGLVACGGLLWLAFASARAVLVALLPVATGVVAGIAAVGTAFGTVHGITLGFGSTLIGEAVDYAIYYLIQARTGGWRRWRDVQWPTVRLGLLTSLCGFVALVFSGFPGLAQLGVFSIAGLVAAALATRYVLPVLVPDGAAGEGLRARLGAAAAQAAEALPRRRWVRGTVLAATLAAVVFLVWRGDAVWRGDLASLSPLPADALAFDTALRADLGASDARTLVVANGATADAALEAAAAAGPALDALVDAGRLAGYDSPARLLPPQALQRARIAALPDASALRERLVEATRGGPLKAERLDGFVADVQAARTQPPLAMADLRGTPLKAALDAMLFERPGGGWSALLPLQPAAGVVLDAGEIAKGLAAPAAAHEIQVVDIKRSLDALYARYLHEALVLSALGALAVVAIVAVQLRSARRVLAVCEPLAAAAVLTLAGLALAGAPLGILHLVGLLLVVAVGSNYGLFFDLWRVSGRRPDGDTLASLALANVTTVIGFGLLAASDIPALSSVGRVVAPGALLALVLSAAMPAKGTQAGRE